MPPLVFVVSQYLLTLIKNRSNLITMRKRKKLVIKSGFPLLPIVSFLLLLLAIGLLTYQLSKAPKEVKAVAGTLEIGGSIGKGNFPGGIWNTSGNVGIGTTAPNDKLEISGNLRFTGANPYITASSYFIAPGGAYFNSGTVYTKAQIQARGGIADDGGVLELNDDVNIGAGDLYVVNSSGNVGIGTTAPTVKLDVVGGLNITGNTNICTLVAYTGGVASSCPSGYFTSSAVVGPASGHVLCCKKL